MWQQSVVWYSVGQWRILKYSVIQCNTRHSISNRTFFVLFLHNSYGTSEFPDCGNLVGADCMGNLRWANTEPSMPFRKTNADPSMHFRKANTDPSMHFRKANTKFLLPLLLPTPNFTSKFTPSFISKITINLLHHDVCNMIPQETVNWAHCTFCVSYIVLFSAGK